MVFSVFVFFLTEKNDYFERVNWRQTKYLFLKETCSTATWFREREICSLVTEPVPWRCLETRWARVEGHMAHTTRGPQRMSGSWEKSASHTRDWRSLRRCMEHQGRRDFCSWGVGSPGWPCSKALVGLSPATSIDTPSHGH